MLKKLAIILCLGSMCMLGMAQNEAQRATEMYKEGRYKEAIAVLDEAIAAYPDWYFPILMKGRCNHKLGNMDQALQNFNDALTLEIPAGDIPSVKYSIAQIYMSKKDYYKAIRAYDDLMALVAENRHFDLLFNKAQAQMQIGKAAEDANDPKKALEFFSKSVRSFSEALAKPTRKAQMQIEASFQKAYGQYKIGNNEGSLQSLLDSIKSFEEVLKRDPKHETAHRFLIEVAFKLVKEARSDNEKSSRYGDAVTFIDRYLAFWPDNTEMLFKKGQALQGMDKYKEAITVFQKVVQKEPKNGSAYFSLGSCQMASKQLTDAIKSFQSSLQNGESKNHNNYLFIAYCYQEQKNGCYGHDIPLYQSAVSILERGLKAIPNQSAIKSDLQAKQNNLNILKENKSTDLLNSQAAIENVQKLVESMEANKAKLARNQELYIQQPTDELKTAIDEGKEAITSSEKDLQKELSLMEGYVKDARRCGGQSANQHYNQMVKILKDNGRL